MCSNKRQAYGKIRFSSYFRPQKTQGRKNAVNVQETAIVKRKIQLVGMAGLTLLMAAGGLQILLLGRINSVSSGGAHHFDGIERLVGLLPLGIGVLFFALIAMAIRDEWRS
jgi:hypothetical protein